MNAPLYIAALSALASRIVFPMSRHRVNRIAAMVAVALLPHVAWAQSPAYTWRVEVEAPDELRALLQTHLEINRYRDRPEVDATVLDRLIERAPADARALLATEGYFSPQLNIERVPSAAEHVVRVHVVPGAPAIVSAVALEVVGAIAANPDDAARLAQIKQRWRLPQGARFRQETWDAAKDALLSALVLDGYPTARLAASEAKVDPTAHRVTLNVRVDSGPLFHFGAVNINGLQRYPRTLVENLNPIRPGARYTHDALLRYQSALQASGYFRSASVSIAPESGGATTVPIVIRVEEQPAQKVDLGAGYSTDTGPRLQAGYTHYNTFQPGWQSHSKLKLEGKQQSLDSELAFLPEPNGWRNRVNAEAKRTDVEGLTTQRVALSGSRAFRSLRLEHDFTVKFQTETQKIKAARTDHLQALSLNYSWTLRGVDDPVRPTEGYLINLQLGGASSALLSTRSFVRSYGRGIYILPLGKRDRLHLRAEAGAVWAAARDGIPLEFLFRAGGDQSIRGYAYQSLGVREGAAVVGARYLLAGTLEYQHDFTPEWGGALFVDSGNATDSRSDFRMVQGYGLGARWISPAGTLNFDIARASEDRKFRFHFTIGARF